MDKSSNYVKMCESAKVIQKQWKPEFGDFFVSMSLGLTSPCQPITNDLEKKVSYLKTIKAVWLPRQDQLQGMVIENYATPWDLAIAFSNVLMGARKMHRTLKILIVWKNYGLLLSCLKNIRGNGTRENGFNRISQSASCLKT